MRLRNFKMLDQRGCTLKEPLSALMSAREEKGYKGGRQKVFSGGGV